MNATNNDLHAKGLVARQKKAAENQIVKNNEKETKAKEKETKAKDKKIEQETKAKAMKAAKEARTQEKSHYARGNKSHKKMKVNKQ